MLVYWLLDLFCILHKLEYVELRGDGGTVGPLVQWRVKLGIIYKITYRINRQQWCSDFKISTLSM